MKNENMMMKSELNRADKSVNNNKPVKNKEKSIKRTVANDKIDRRLLIQDKRAHREGVQQHSAQRPS